MSRKGDAMKKIGMKSLLTVIAILLLSQEGLAAPLSSDDFLPPVQAQNEEQRQEAMQVKQPDAVVRQPGLDGKNATFAATAQDAVNAAADRIAMSGGCEQIKFPSGFGWVAVGTGTYALMPNPVAMLEAQRLAYQKAYIDAKKALAESLHGLSVEGREQLGLETKALHTENDSATNFSEKLSESLTEQVEGLLRGYVVYNVNDRQEKNAGIVTVTLVTTPKTMGLNQRIDASSVAADSIRDGLNHVLAEISAGLIPPIGGKTISVPQTGELAFVGFGSAVAQPHTNPAAQAKLALNARKIAVMRARSALCGIILGDSIRATESLDTQTKALNEEFAELQADDPLNKDGNAPQSTKLREQRETFLSTQLHSEQISSMRSGVLPPGVRIKTFFNEEKTLVYGVAVYLPSASSQASQAGRRMNDARILSGGSAAHGGGVMPSRGASGQVMEDADL